MINRWCQWFTDVNLLLSIYDKIMYLSAFEYPRGREKKWHYYQSIGNRLSIDSSAACPKFKCQSVHCVQLRKVAGFMEVGQNQSVFVGQNSNSIDNHMWYNCAVIVTHVFLTWASIKLLLCMLARMLEKWMWSLNGHFELYRVDHWNRLFGHWTFVVGHFHCKNVPNMSFYGANRHWENVRIAKHTNKQKFKLKSSTISSQKAQKSYIDGPL